MIQWLLIIVMHFYKLFFAAIKLPFALSIVQKSIGVVGSGFCNCIFLEVAMP